MLRERERLCFVFFGNRLESKVRSEGNKSKNCPENPFSIVERRLLVQLGWSSFSTSQELGRGRARLSGFSGLSDGDERSLIGTYNT